MSATSILAIVFLALAGANVLHWSLVRRGPVVWMPSGRWLQIVGVYNLTITAVAFASLSGWLPSSVLPWMLLPLFASQQVVSIMKRQDIAPPGNTTS